MNNISERDIELEALLDKIGDSLREAGVTLEDLLDATRKVVKESFDELYGEDC